jgi:crotonobetainyl-CoA:carnitine CoA-transferase CaiB-like acyl-CoA transferase
MQNRVNVKEWVAMFEEIGLNHAQMERWHKVFETRHPAAHQTFLEWLGIKPEDIDRIRSESR